MSQQRILRHVNDGLCTLTLNRPEKLNALDTATFDELDSHLAALENETASIGCVVLRANGRAFCAGADLGAMGVAADGTPVDSRYKPRVIDRLSALPQPVIAVVHGTCVTGGLELALACDFIVADPSARFADTHGKWGLVSAWGMMQRLPRRVGTAAAQRIMMTSRQLDIREALAIGLVDLATDEHDLEAAIRALTSDILANSWHTNFAVKRTSRETEGMNLAAALAYENLHSPGNAPDHVHRIASFGKR